MMLDLNSGASPKLEFYDDIDEIESFYEEEDSFWQEYLDYAEIQELLKEQEYIIFH